jgi:hypothetical protein
MWRILIDCVVLYFGLVIGFLVCELMRRNRTISGTIYVIRTDEKTLYSLELTEDPEMIEFKKKVVFKVDNSKDGLDRD